MNKCISTSAALFATAMMVTLSFGCGEGIEGDTGSQSAQVNHGELNNGQCNRIVARALGIAQQCNKFGCSSDGPECAELGATFVEFFFLNPECGIAAGNGELNGLPGNASIQPGGPNAGDPKNIVEVICGAIEECGSCGDAQGAGICLETDACN